MDLNEEVRRGLAEAGRTAAELFTAMGWEWDEGLAPDATDLALMFLRLLPLVGVDQDELFASSGRLLLVNTGDGEILLAVEVGSIDLEVSDA